MPMCGSVVGRAVLLVRDVAAGQEWLWAARVKVLRSPQLEACGLVRCEWGLVAVRICHLLPTACCDDPAVDPCRCRRPIPDRGC